MFVLFQSRVAAEPSFDASEAAQLYLSHRAELAAKGNDAAALDDRIKVRP